jgi:hypothetical protein
VKTVKIPTQCILLDFRSEEGKYFVCGFQRGSNRPVFVTFFEWYAALESALLYAAEIKCSLFLSDRALLQITEER